MGIRNTFEESQAYYRLMKPGRKMPVYALVFVTSRCNAACDHCFYWRELNDRVKEELTLSEYEQLAQSFGKMFQITLTGGSPELRKDLPEITEIFHKNCRPNNITFCMLGHATTRILSHVEEILKRCSGQRITIAISLDGIGEEHDELRKLPGCFDRAVKTINSLGELKKHYPNLRIAIGTTVHGLNYKTVAKTARWARENLPIDLLKPILVRGNPCNDNTRNIDKICNNTYLNVLDGDKAWINGTRTTRFSPMDYVINAKESLQRDIISEIATTGKSPVTCSAGRETAVIYPYGEVAGCELREDERLGNLRDVDMDFSKIWFGEKADNFRDTIGQAKDCSGCYHHCFLSPAVFRTSKLWGKLVRTANEIYWNKPDDYCGHHVPADATS